LPLEEQTWLITAEPSPAVMAFGDQEGRFGRLPGQEPFGIRVMKITGLERFEQFMTVVEAGTAIGEWMSRGSGPAGLVLASVSAGDGCAQRPSTRWPEVLHQPRDPWR